MSSYSLVIKQGNLWPPLIAYLYQADGTVVPLTDTTQVHLIVVNETNEVIVDTPAEVIDAATAMVQYEWQSGDTAIPGTYRAEFVVILPGDTPVTIPNDTTITLTITPALPRSGV